MQIITKCLPDTPPLFSWILTDCDDRMQTAYNIQVYTPNGKVVWQSGPVESDASVNVRYIGAPLEANTRYLWKVTVSTEKGKYESDEASFITGIYDFDKLTWVCPSSSVNSPIIHKEFHIDKVCDYATLNICGLGYFEVYINDQKVSDELMSPVRTDYGDVEYKDLKYPFLATTRKSYMYVNYEVSQYLKEGNNKISVWLGNGWYIQNDRIVEGLFIYGNNLKTAFRLVNGSDIIESDENCYWSQSPIEYDNIFYGETYDFRKDITQTQSVCITPSPSGTPKCQLCPPERATHIYEPDFADGIYDAKACITGFAELCLSGNSGDEVKIYFSEDKTDDGELDYTSTVGYEESDKTQIQCDTVILSGKPGEVYKPRFVWHAFRYFKICAPDSVKIEDVKVHYVCTDVKQRTSFDCSSSLLNDIHKMSLNTQLTNTHGCMPMDCPHRERLGYTGDGQLSSLSVMTNFDAHTMYTKWVTDILDAQDTETGFVPHTAPFCGGAGGHGWGSAVAIVPWNMYCQYGDKEIIKKASEPIRKWIEYLVTRQEENLITFEQPGSWCLGEWCLPSKYPWSEPHLDEIKIPSELVNTVYFILCCDIYTKICDILGNKPEEWIAKRRAASADAVNKMLSDNNYAGGEQGSNIFPLYVDIVPEESREAVLENAISRLMKNNYCFETGLAGTCFTLRVLDKYGRNDVATKMMLNTRYPSFGNMIKNGATSLWETWEGNGSRNHTAFSSADAWFTFGLAGVKALGGYKEFVLKPYFAPELDYLDFELESEYGTIAVHWKRCDKGIEVELTVPFNTTAHVELGGRCFDLKAGIYKEVIHNEDL